MNMVEVEVVGFAGAQLAPESSGRVDVSRPVHSLVSGGSAMSYLLFSVVS
jgi:hypothetical protein